MSKIDFDLLPRTTVIGRVANRLNLMRTRNGIPYLQLFIYLYHDGNAKLCPVRVFNKLAEDMARRVNQGDLLNINARVDIDNHHGYLDVDVIGSSYTFLEPKAIRDVYRGRTGKALNVLFPSVPSNFRTHSNSRSIISSNEKKSETSAKPRAKHKAQAHKTKGVKSKPKVASVSVKVRPKPKKKVHNAKKKPNDNDWMSKISHLGDDSFPKM